MTGAGLKRLRAMGLNDITLTDKALEPLYFDFAALEQRMRLLRRLVAGREKLIVVLGEKGSGKSLFLQRFLESSGLKWQKLHIHVTDRDVGKAPAVTCLHDHPVYVLRDASHRTLIFDDAHELGQQALDFLQRTVTGCSPPHKDTCLVLLGELSLSAKITAACKTLREDSAVSKIFMPAFSETETADFLWQRFDMAGASGLRLISRPIARKIQQSTGGVPGLVAAATEAWLRKHAKPDSGIASHRRLWHGRRLQQVLSAITAVGDLLTTGMRDQTDHCGRDGNSPQMICSGKLPLEGSGDDRRPLTAPDGPRGSERQIKFSCPSPGNVPVESTGARGQRRSQDPAVGPPLPSAEILAPGGTDAEQPHIHREEWLLSQNPSHYTIQVLGAKTEKALAAIIKTHRLPTNRQVARFRTSYKGETAFPLLWGLYHSRSEARSAVEDLPDKLKKFYPLVRRLSSIQHIILAGGSIQ